MRGLALAFLLLAGFGLAAQAVELPENRPTDRATIEQRLNSATEMPPHKLEGFVHIPDQNERVLVQPMGRTFRDFRTRVQPWFDAALIVVAVLSMAALYWFAGPMPYTRDPAGRTIQRFTWFERLVHWLTAVSFLWLAITGLNLVFGRRLLEPILGDDAFARLSALAKLSHNSVAFAFMAGLLVMSIQWLKNNLPSRLDIAWIKSAGGMFGGAHPPTQKFNAGQKMIYWIAVFGGGAISLTGIALLTPFSVFDITGMQVMQVLHSVIAGLMIAVIIGHIYLGSVGVPGSFDAMATGRVDLNWAKTHHGLWVEEQERKGAIPAGSAAPPMHPAE